MRANDKRDKRFENIVILFLYLYFILYKLYNMKLNYVLCNIKLNYIIFYINCYITDSHTL